MRHRVDGRQFGRNTSHRKALFRNMANAVIEKEQIVTTVEKAKEVRRVVERLITLGKTKKPEKRRLAFDRTRNEFVVKKLFTDLADRYSARPGGYTRVIKMAKRRVGDGAELAVLELVDHPKLDRRRKSSAAVSSAHTHEGHEHSHDHDGEHDHGHEGHAVEAEPLKAPVIDPLKRFRRLFQGKRSNKKTTKA